MMVLVAETSCLLQRGREGEKKAWRVTRPKLNQPNQVHRLKDLNIVHGVLTSYIELSLRLK